MVITKPKHKNFLFEIGTEELPPKRIRNLVASLAENITNGLQEHSLAYEQVQTYATPRRLAVLITNLSTKQPDQLVEFRGPPMNIAFDKEGKATIAAERFAQSCKVTVEQLKRKEDSKGSVLFYETINTGKETTQLLPEIIVNSLKQLPISRPMRWGHKTEFFIRPVHWIVMLFGEETIPVKIFGVQSSNQTFGHRFHCPGPINISQPEQYQALLATTGFVIADVDERRQKICDQIETKVKTGNVNIKEELLNEVTDLVEWPVAVVGSFDSHFLEMPPEVLITTMEKQQRYFPITDKNNKLLPRFVIINNIDSSNPGRVIKGNERVIKARLADAEYFYRNDLQVSFESYRDRLKTVIFQEKLGSVYDKTVRLEKLASYIATKVNGDVVQAVRAATLSKCDLMSSMVWEFPELQGTMGEYYASQQEDKEIAIALREQYLPRFSQDKLPLTKVGSILALVDRVDNLIGLFGINKIPTGEKDPLGLRRAATGILRIILDNNWFLDLQELFEQARLIYADNLTNPQVVSQALSFIYERLRYIYLEQGKNPNIFRAVLACLPTDLQDFEKRFVAVETFSKLSEAKDLIEIYKRVRNILDKANYSDDFEFNVKLITEPEEKELARLIKQEGATIVKLYESKDYLQILELLVKAKPVLSNFFTKVMVMVEEDALRLNRLALLKKLYKLFVLVADLAELV